MDFFVNSSTTSLQSSNNSSYKPLSNRSSVYTPNIERQLHSLVTEDEDTPQDTAQLLQQTFDQLDIETQEHSTLTSCSQHRPISSLMANEIIQSGASDKDYSSSSCKSNSILCNEDDDSRIFSVTKLIPSLLDRYQDFSAFTYPFSEQPVITGTASTGFYIPTPTSIRNFLDYPNTDILERMALPYPFRVKEPVSQRLDRSARSSSFMSMNSQQSSFQQQQRKKTIRDSNQKPTSYYQSIRPSKRHSLALGQVDQILRKNSVIKTNTLIKPEEPIYKRKHQVNSRDSLSSDRTQNIIAWMPDVNSQWQENNSNNSSKKKYSMSSKLGDTNLSPKIRLARNSEHDNNCSFYTENQLHPLDNMKMPNH
ncbi:hypothetical protein BD408DRAFT_443680 [Parasitella parasitica]|nr:hypothetical protein BD408DRAFT_443680 [Parasitella parasitica]